MNFENFRKYTNLEKDMWYKVVGHDQLLRKRGQKDVIIGENTIIDSSATIYGARLGQKQIIHIKDNCYIGPNVYLRGKIEIGDYSWIGPFAQINGEGGCTIGKGVGIGNSVIILTCEHEQPNLNQPISFGELVKNTVIIEDGTNIGVGSIILPGVRAEKGAQIGAGSVVTKNEVLRKYEIWAGNPARLIGTRE